MAIIYSFVFLLKVQQIFFPNHPVIMTGLDFVKGCDGSKLF